MKRSILLSLVLMVIMLTGCLGKQLPYKDVQPETGKAVIYVYRPASFLNSAETMILEVNGEEKGYLSHSFHLYAFAAPGDATLLLKKNVFPYNEYGRLVVKDVQEGETYYVKADPIAMGGFDMILMDERQGRQEAMATKYFVNE